MAPGSRENRVISVTVRAASPEAHTNGRKRLCGYRPRSVRCVDVPPQLSTKKCKKGARMVKAAAGLLLDQQYNQGKPKKKIKAVLSLKFSELHLHLEVRVAASDQEQRRHSASLWVHRSQPAHLMEQDWRVKFKSVVKLGQTVGWDSPDLNLVEEAQWTVGASLYLFVTSLLLARETEEGEELQLSNITRALPRIQWSRPATTPWSTQTTQWLVPSTQLSPWRQSRPSQGQSGQLLWDSRQVPAQGLRQGESQGQHHPWQVPAPGHHQGESQGQQLVGPLSLARHQRFWLGASPPWWTWTYPSSASVTKSWRPWRRWRNTGPYRKCSARRRSSTWRIFFSQ